MADEAPYVPYAQRPEWSDLEPIAQKDAENPLVPIAYTEKYRDAMDTFRALVHAGEKSARGIELTEVLIRLNPGHYSIWAYRAEILLETKADLSKELDLMDELVKEHLKSYQVWQHRRSIVLALNSSDREIGFTTRALSFDAKNYHTWAYRQWALCHFFAPSGGDTSASKENREEVWKGEIEYVDRLLEEDVRNNSAWNHRYFVAFESGAEKGDGIVERELKYVKTKLALSPNNPSAWSYLRGILKFTSTPHSTLIPFVSPLASLSSATPSTRPTETDGIPIPAAAELPAYLAIEFLADACVEQATKLFSTAKSEAEEKSAEAAALFRSLIQYDPIRTKYWEYRATESVKAVGA
ncbi:protein farnesyltransferase/geranylgeranyltransferase type-1 subunit alpha [Pseudohyphozyma bogoriensis]|nr:protein farnesyltransferase/geranylgeranyltransferase type-1 subunit alpha [Pseudohyphozyma bogoriensis]